MISPCPSGIFLQRCTKLIPAADLRLDFLSHSRPSFYPNQRASNRKVETTVVICLTDTEIIDDTKDNDNHGSNHDKKINDNKKKNDQDNDNDNDDDNDNDNNDDDDDIKKIVMVIIEMIFMMMM